MSYRHVIWSGISIHVVLRLLVGMRRGRSETARGDGWATHVAVTAKVLEQLDLAQGALCENLLAKDICDLLDSDAFVGLVVDGSTTCPDEAGLSSANAAG